MSARNIDRDVQLRQRIQTASLIVLVGYAGLTLRLVYLQGLQGAALRKEAIHRRQGKITLPARRGTIYGRDGQPMGASIYTGKVGFDPAVMQVDPHNQKPAAAIAKLQAHLAQSIKNAAPILGLTQATLEAKVNAAIAEHARNPKLRFSLIRSGLTVEQANMIRQARPSLLGFGVIDGTVRAYSSGSNAAQVIGFTDVNGVGMAGLERGCGKWLTGTNGVAVAEMDPQKREIPDTQVQVTPAQDGLNVVTTLDPNAQHIATDEAQQIVAKFHPVGVSVVIVEPATGDILAMVSLPNYDANPDPDHPGRRAPIPVMALKDRCIGDTYEPGSTLKTLTIAAALDAGLITPSNTYYCSGEFRVGKRFIHCADGETHHTVNVQDILRESCNIGAAQIGLHMGGPRLEAADQKFGLFDRYDLGLPVQCAGRWSSDPREQPYSPGKTARVAFGHSITSTPLHVAMAYAAIANGGVLMRPRLVTKLVDSQGRTVRQWQPQVARRVLSPQTSTLVAQMLRSVVSDGTGIAAAVPGYQIAGKTGTASKYKPGAYVGSFTGFIPAGPTSTPRAVILIAVDTPDASNGYFGGKVAAPYFKNIAQRLMAVWRVPEDDPNGTQALAAVNSQRRLEHLPAVASLTAAHARTE